MAKVAEDQEWTGKSTTAIYPWDEWLDGQIWILTPGEDFTVPLHSMRTMASSAAARKGMSIRTSVKNGTELWIQAIRKGGG